MPAFFSKALESITAADVADLIGWPESFTVEFKEQLPGRDGRQDAWVTGGSVEKYAKEKLWREIVAFANTNGGDLIVGIAEDKSAPPSAVTITPIPRCLLLAESLQRAAQTIDPPIPMLQVRGVEVDGDAGVVIFRVPASRSAPHRSTDKDCFVRRGSETMPMDMRQIQEMTLTAARRGEANHLRFESASQNFRDWCHGFDGVAFRITASPSTTVLNLGRTYGAEKLFEWRSGYRLKDERTTQPALIAATRFPDRRSPILRGERWQYREDSLSPVRLDILSDGFVNFWFKQRVPTEKNLLPAAWVCAYLLNILELVDGLRMRGAAPDAEYAVEFEISGDRRTVILHDWIDHSWSRDLGLFTSLPLIFPRMSFGPRSEMNHLLSLMMTDMFDASEANLREPLSLTVM